MRTTCARATEKSDVIFAGLGASTVVSSSSRGPTDARADTPALCARPVTVRPDLPPTRACRPSDKTCLMFNVNLLATLSVLSKQVGERPSIALSLSRVVVVGPWIHRNRVTFAVPWPKRRPTW